MGKNNKRKRIEDEAEPEREPEPPFNNDEFKIFVENQSPSSAGRTGKKQKHNSNDTIPKSDGPPTPPPVSKKQDTVTTPLTGDHEDRKEDVAYAEPQKLTAARVLFPKTGGIYDNLKPLEEVSKSDPTFDVGREMADSVQDMKFISSSKPVIDIAGEKVDKGAMLLQEGEKLVAEAQYILRSAINDLSNLLH